MVNVDFDEHLLASNFAFGAAQQGVTALDSVATGAFESSDLLSAWTIASAGANQWKNEPSIFLSTNRDHRVVFYARPLAANADALLGISQGAQTSWTGLAAIMRFNTNNTIDVRNGGSYMADVAFPYVPDTSYQINIIFNMNYPGPGNFYSVWVTGPDGKAVQIANHYAFRSAQQNVTFLNNWVVEANPGSLAAFLLNTHY